MKTCFCDGCGNALTKEEERATGWKFIFYRDDGKSPQKFVVLRMEVVMDEHSTMREVCRACITELIGSNNKFVGGI
jgi:hypothetical protein